MQDIALYLREFDVLLMLREGRTREGLLEHYEKAYEREAEVMNWKGGLYK